MFQWVRVIEQWRRRRTVPDAAVPPNSVPSPTITGDDLIHDQRADGTIVVRSNPYRFSAGTPDRRYPARAERNAPESSEPSAVTDFMNPLNPLSPIPSWEDDGGWVHHAHDPEPTPAPHVSHSASHSDHSSGGGSSYSDSSSSSSDSSYSGDSASASW